MRVYLTCVFLALTFGFKALAYELLMVQAVSSSKKTFVTRQGKRQGVIENATATFTADDIAVIARAMTVTSQYTQWELVNPEAQVPFEAGTLITYHPAQEYLWALNPEAARKQYIRELKPEVQRAFLIKGAMTRGLNETVSTAAPQSASRGGIALDLLYEKIFHPNFSWDLGMRYENEVINLTGGSLITQRLMLLGNVTYYFDPLEQFYRAKFFIGAGAAYGQSSTSADGLVQSGFAMLLPTFKLGVNLPFNKEWEFITESALETLKTTEELADDTKQTTNQTNFRLAFGLRRFF